MSVLLGLGYKKRPPSPATMFTKSICKHYLEVNKRCTLEIRRGIFSENIKLGYFILDSSHSWSLGYL